MRKRTNKFDDDVSDLTVRLHALLTLTTPTGMTAMALARRPFTRKLSRVRAGLERIEREITPDDAVIEHSQLSQYQDELSDYKKDLASLYEELITKDILDDDELLVTHSVLE